MSRRPHSKPSNGIVSPISQMAPHAAALVAKEPWAVQIAHGCESTQVELLRYPVPTNKQAPGQTMAVGAIAQSLKRYGEAVLITALQHPDGQQSTQRTVGPHDQGFMRRPASCSRALRERLGLAAIQEESTFDAAGREIGRERAMSASKPN
jgi:hypothetical protein